MRQMPSILHTRGTEGRAANQYVDIERKSFIEVEETDKTMGDPEGRATRLTVYAENGIEQPYDVAFVRLAPEKAAALGRRLAQLRRADQSDAQKDELVPDADRLARVRGLVTKLREAMAFYGMAPGNATAKKRSRIAKEIDAELDAELVALCSRARPAGLTNELQEWFDKPDVMTPYGITRGELMRRILSIREGDTVSHDEAMRRITDESLTPQSAIPDGIVDCAFKQGVDMIHKRERALEVAEARALKLGVEVSEY